MQLAEFNSLDEAAATETVSVWAAIPAWVEAIVSSRPYASAGSLRDYAAALAEVWTVTELDQALAQHPRIGESAHGDGADAAASRSEQSAMADASVDVADRIAAGNRAYEQKFGRVFLIRAAGRAPEEILANLSRRLENHETAETSESLQQLREIALLRLAQTVPDEEPPPESPE